MTYTTPPVYQKCDMRKLLMILGAIDELGNRATIKNVASRCGTSHDAVYRLIIQAEEQLGVVF